MPGDNEHELVSPVTQAIVAPFDGAPRLPSLAGTRLGIIDDAKKNANVLLEELVDRVAFPLVLLIHQDETSSLGVDRVLTTEDVNSFLIHGEFLVDGDAVRPTV